MHERLRTVPLDDMRPWLLLVSLSACAPPLTQPSAAAPTVETEIPHPQVRAHRAPAPLSGGSLALTPDGRMAIAADPDRDVVWRVDLEGEALEVLEPVWLDPGDRPGRVVVDDVGVAHVTLRGAAAVVSFATGRPRPRRRTVCPSPTGLAFEGDVLHVACAGGDLVTLDPRGGRRTRELRGDLRDVGAGAEGVWVSRFRSAELVRVSSARAVSTTPPDRRGPVGDVDDLGFAARVAWRTLGAPDGGHWMLHQWHLTDPLVGEALEGRDRYYGGGVVETGVTRFRDGRVERTAAFDFVALPVDAVALAPDRIAVAEAGRREVTILYPETGRDFPYASRRHDGGRPVALAFHPAVGIVTQYVDPPGIGIFEDRRPTEYGGRHARLGEAAPPDRGHELFHDVTARGVACATCHPEGADDGHVWRLDHAARRTQTLTGGIAGSAPFHWAGDVTSFADLMSLVFVERMGGEAPGPGDVEALERWVDTLPDPPRPLERDRDAARRGRALFRDPEIGCARCHSGARGTDGRSHDVGTGGAFQTPPLVGLAERLPLFHDGCAETLEARFAECHTPGHGRIEHLDDGQRADLVAHLRSF